MIQIQFDQADLSRWMRALRRLKIRASHRINKMQRDCAIEYYQLVHANIVTEKYAGGYTPYSKTYAKWKQKKGYLYPGWWKLSLNLIHALTVFKQGDGWVGGIPPGATGERGRPISIYGAAGEFKSVRLEQPARPIFEPTMQEYAKEAWKKKGQENLSKIREAWA